MDTTPLRSYSSDNTSEEAATEQAENLLGSITHGMRVFDSAGDEIGKVDGIRVGEPDAVTIDAASRDVGADTLLDNLANVFAGDETQGPDAMRDRYLREGFVHIDGKGWTDTDRYALASQVALVESGVVRLSVAKEALAEG